MSSPTQFAQKFTKNSRKATALMSSSLIDLGCVQINFVGVFLTCKKQALRNLQREQQQATLVAIKEYGEQYDNKHR
jgi:hypothetical protein